MQRRKDAKEKQSRFALVSFSLAPFAPGFRAVVLVYPHFGWLRELRIALKLSNQFMDVATAIES